MKRAIKIIEAINTLAGNVLCWLAFLLMLVVVYEVVARYLFNAPTEWSMEINQFLLGVISLLGGGYCLLKDEHVRVDLFYPKYSPRTLAIVELCTYPFVLFMCVVLIYFGGTEFWHALIEHKTTNSVMEFPVWPMWFVVAFGALLLGIQVIARYLRHIMTLSGQSE